MSDDISELGHISASDLLRSAQELWQRDQPGITWTDDNRLHYLAIAASVWAQEAVMLDREHSGAWPCNGRGDESGNFVCTKDTIIADLRARLAAASEFSFGERIAIMRRKQRDGAVKWSVNDGGSVLNADGEWEHEPSPSNRSDEFIAATRFTFEEAWAKAEARATAIDLARAMIGFKDQRSPCGSVRVSP